MSTAFVMCALIAVLWGVVTLVGWKRPARVSLVPGWIASIAAGTAFAIAMSSADAASALRSLLIESGNPSRAAVAAWMVDALRPAVATSFFAAAMMLVTLVLLQRVRGEGGGATRNVTMTSVVLAALVASIVLHHRAVDSMRAMDPTSIARANWSIGIALLTGLASIVIVAMTLKPRERPASENAARTLRILAVLAFLITLGGALWFRADARFYLELAMNGR